MGEKDTLIKMLLDQDTRRILGCHIVGSHASDLCQQIVYLMNAGNEDYLPIVRAQIIHPALSEALARVLGKMRPAGEAGVHAHEHEHHGHSH